MSRGTICTCDTCGKKRPESTFSWFSDEGKEVWQCGLCTKKARDKHNARETTLNKYTPGWANYI